MQWKDGECEFIAKEIWYPEGEFLARHHEWEKVGICPFIIVTQTFEVRREKYEFWNLVCRAN